MMQQNRDEGTEWIFCAEINGKCPGVNPNSIILERIPKTIKVQGKDVAGWLVKIVQEKGEGHLDLDITRTSDE